MAQLQATDFIWRDGEFVLFKDATIHVLAHSMQFGSSAFEGIRCYNTSAGPAIFLLEDHLQRLLNSCKVYRMEVPYGIDELVAASCELVEKNKLDSCYIRPMVLRGFGAAGMVPFESPVEVFIPCWPWGAYLGEGALEKGVDACISSWNRMAPNTTPSMAKVAGNYRGVIYTTPANGTLLPGITRDSVITLARDAGMEVREQPLPREMVYSVDECFLTGTASEVTPVRSVDKIVVGKGKAGEVTKLLQRTYLDIVRGKIEDRHGWLTHVRAERASAT